MKINRKKFVLVFLILSFIVTTYIFFKKQNHSQNIKPKQNIVISSKTLTNSEFTKNFKGFNYFQNRDTRNKYKAIQLDIENQSNKEYILYKNGIDLNIIKPERIKRKLKISNTIIPTVTSGLISSSFIFYFGLAYVPSTLAALAGGTTASSMLNVNKTNANLEYNISNKSFDLLHGILIPSKEKVRTILFTRKEDVIDNFVVRLINKTDNISESFQVTQKKDHKTALPGQQGANFPKLQDHHQLA